MQNDFDHHPQHHLIETAAALQETALSLLQEKIVAADLEADSLFHFAEKVCLLQISTPAECFLIDPLAVPDLSCLKPLFADESITKVFHGADYDIRCLYRDFSIVVNNLFDSELACRFLGRTGTGLNAVVRQLFQVTLDKKYQKRDWAARPLPEEMLAYAARDTAYLIPMFHILSEELRDRGRKGWVDEECRLLTRVRSEENDHLPLFMKFKGAGRLGRRQLAVLEAVLQMRQDIARKKDRPPFKVMGNKAIMEIVQAQPKSRKALKNTGAFSGKQLAMYGDEVVKAIAEALALPQAALPVYPRQKRSSPSPQMTRRLKCLKEWRDERAAGLYLSPGLIFPKSLLVAVGEKNPASLAELDRIENLRQWQKENFGREIVSLLNEIC